MSSAAPLLPERVAEFVERRDRRELGRHLVRDQLRHLVPAAFARKRVEAHAEFAPAVDLFLGTRELGAR